MKRKSLYSFISSSSSSFFNLVNILALFVFLSETVSSVDPHYEACEPRNCGNQRISYPFWIADVQEPYCGYPGFKITCQDHNPILHIPENDYLLHQILYENLSVRVSPAAFLHFESGCRFPPISNLSVQDNIFTIAPNVSHLYLLSNCSSPLPPNLLDYKIRNCSSSGTEREDDLVLAMLENDKNLSFALEECKRDVLAPVEMHKGDDRGVGNHKYTDVLTRGFALNWRASNCSRCQESGGRCGFDLNNSYFKCFCPDRPHFVRCKTRRNHKRILVTVIPGSVILLLCMLTLIIWRHKKWIHLSSYSRNTSSDPSSRADLEGGGIFFGVPVYSYVELEEATNNFDPSRELGDGGFGTVYHGKLRDGREVAVKRLYEHNYKRVTQFINEIEILTRLRHPNLVSLYGCTSRHCRELLLVYEYIPNGTVADHLHGDQARDGSLTWPIRMNIAIETASALAYLHASDIIHRDVKTNNILLDNNFSVKVADFGLSRLFPNDVTHVSTAPQGTPGYVDPEYHQCYRLTNKSDVYSFGVVLVELISSMPAVDISRHRHEINLANLAMNRIQHRAFSELIDPSFGFESDSSIERMTTSVAEVAFRCLQLEKEMRPTMDEVLEALKEIQEYNDENTAEVNTEDVDVLTSKQPPPSPEGDHVGLLLKDRKVLTSPDSVTNIWNSGGSTTTSISSG